MLTTRYAPGAPNWIDLTVRDLDAAAAFYGAVFGWEFLGGGPEVGGYGMFRIDGKTVAGMGPLMREGANPAWTIYFHTPDAEATAKAVEQAGGSVDMPPMDVMTLGRMAVFTDPTGAQFAVWQPGENRGLDVVDAPNTLFWTELYTTDAEAARGFYRTVFDWNLREAPVPGGGTYLLVAPSGGGEETTQGGIMQLRPENLEGETTSNWHPYFAVEDCDAVVARATERGATVLIPAVDMEGVGRFAMFMDPFDATFAVLTPATPPTTPGTT
ncbi:VOC family protein [Allostreptomyces psammosilenae]|uniref:VOC domain-containing protein n=1 Tax=Allostreptomyces psammosilenae TaxID=1892865 RepID=A0A852ZP92_9ACTN|nr:VOC family protein [Allostreptomyces psammosilenae]NYI03545.1 hypothetical protein [Allostreptomyces psammosilenae]